MNYEFERALHKIEALVYHLKQELPGIAFGNMGHGAGSDAKPLNGRKAGWYIFLPHTNRVGTDDDWVYLGATEDDLVKKAGNPTDLAAQVKHMYHAGGSRVVSTDMDISSEVTAVRLTQKLLDSIDRRAIS